MKNRITELFGIEYPIIQGGMIWCAGAKLAAAVSSAGGLGLIGSGSMRPDLLREHIKKAKSLTDKPFGVNIPLIYKYSEEFVSICIEEDIPIVFTSAGSPKKYTPFLKSNNITVVHVVPNVKLALKCQQAGVDAVVAEGFEAGGHNGADEITTMVLIPQVVDALDIPVIAAGGIGDGRAMAASFALGAEGVQVGTRFAATIESSAHPAFKEAIVRTSDTGTRLALKKVVPVRLILNDFAKRVLEMEMEGAAEEQLRQILGEGRARKGMFEGDTSDGELEAGQVSGLINDIPHAEEVIKRMLMEYARASVNLPTL